MNIPDTVSSQLPTHDDLITIDPDVKYYTIFHTDDELQQGSNKKQLGYLLSPTGKRSRNEGILFATAQDVLSLISRGNVDLDRWISEVTLPKNPKVIHPAKGRPHGERMFTDELIIQEARNLNMVETWEWILENDILGKTDDKSCDFAMTYILKYDHLEILKLLVEKKNVTVSPYGIARRKYGGNAIEILKYILPDRLHLIQSDENDEPYDIHNIITLFSGFMETSYYADILNWIQHKTGKKLTELMTENDFYNLVSEERFSCYYSEVVMYFFEHGFNIVKILAMFKEEKGKSLIEYLRSCSRYATRGISLIVLANKLPEMVANKLPIIVSEQTLYRKPDWINLLNEEDFNKLKNRKVRITIEAI